ncbi:MAG: D-alanyl-D-alanine carboxypeptidase [Bernardetiaceae bacterium]|nr:D-alanyl-D-alanine carboxypeptidase [Bernardetiaceae bacterium]
MSRTLLLTLICLLASLLQAQDKKNDYFANLDKAFEHKDLRYSFHGLMVYDLDKQKTLYSYNADRYFTPASNVKIATFYVGLKALKTQLPSIKYLIKGDSLIFWGTGDPTFLHPKFDNQAVFNFFKQHTNKKLFFATNNFTDEHFGDGWAWEDYRTRFAPEKSAFPIYGNAVEFTADEDCKVTASPEIFIYFSEDENLDTKRKFEITRNLGENYFRYKLDNFKGSVSHTVPFHATPIFIAQLLSDTLRMPVGLIDYPCPANLTTLYTANRNEVLKRVMVYSDNFLAEQTLLMASEVIFGDLNTTQVINFAKRYYLNDLEQMPRWVDGSGLSRYNLFTPHSFVQILAKIHKIMPEKELFEMMAAGGKSGTLYRRYKKYPTFLYAKTGTLSNHHCLSGYLVTKSGKRLCFSFLNNHHIVSAGKIADHMEKILTDIYLNY